MNKLDELKQIKDILKEFSKKKNKTLKEKFLVKKLKKKANRLKKYLEASNE